MKILDRSQVLQELCKATMSYGMYIHALDYRNCIVDSYEFLKAAPYLKIEDHAQVIFDCCGYILFSTEREMLDVYNQTVGDDGPTTTNPYNGSVKVYALTCMPDGQFMHENT
jgi:hypothetical protein